VVALSSSDSNWKPEALNFNVCVDVQSSRAAKTNLVHSAAVYLTESIPKAPSMTIAGYQFSTGILKSIELYKDIYCI
jgi:hypothetical protein